MPSFSSSVLSLETKPSASPQTQTRTTENWPMVTPFGRGRAGRAGASSRARENGAGAESTPDAAMVLSKEPPTTVPVA